MNKEDDAAGSKIDTMSAVKVLTVALMALGMGLTFVYKPITDDIDALRREVIRIESDPAPKPETRVAVAALTKTIDKLSERIDRLDDRINAVHQFLLSQKPQPWAVPKKNDYDVNR